MSFKIIFFLTLFFLKVNSNAVPTITSHTIDERNSLLIFKGVNFSNNTSLLKIYFDDIQQSNDKISATTLEIHVYDFKRVSPGSMSVFIIVDGISSLNNYSVCFPATITSINSVSSRIGGIVTINGFKLKSNSIPNIKPTIKIADQNCDYLDSTSNTLKCSLNPNPSGKKEFLTINVNFGGNCDSNGNGVTFAYDKIKISNSTFSDGIVKINGINLGSSEISKIEVIDERWKRNFTISQFQVSIDEMAITFKLPPLRYRSFDTFITTKNNLYKLPGNASLNIGINERPLTLSGNLGIDLYYVEYGLESLIPNIVIGNSLSSTQCSKLLLNSDFFQTQCPTPYGTGANMPFTFNFHSEFINSTFSYAPPNITSRSFSQFQTNITIYGNNFGNYSQLVKVFFNGSDISKEITLLDNFQFSFRKLGSYQSGLLNVKVDGIQNESDFYLTLPPIIYHINHGRNYSCGGRITINGKNLKNDDEEFRVKVIANDVEATKLFSDEKNLYAKTNTLQKQIKVSVYIGQHFIKSKLLDKYQPKGILNPYYNIRKDSC
ncbi:hypothetical protein ACTA71_002184 [Dictyostelium dimigraforme]